MADNRGNLRGSGIIGRAALVKGTDDFYKLSKALKGADKELRTALHKAVREPAKVVIPKIKQRAGEIQGKGGIGKHYSRKRYTAVTRTGAKTAGVRITGNKTDPRVDEEGRIAHPIFGRKGNAKNGGKNTAVQTVPSAKGFFSETINKEAPIIRDGFLRALDEFTDQIVREAK